MADLSGIPAVAENPASHHIGPYAGPAPWQWRELLLLGLGTAYLLLRAWLGSRGEPFWFDEILGWMLGHDPSLRHMLDAWRQGADGGGASFYLLERAWFAVFSSSDASYRCFSAAAFAAGFATMWVALRRLTGPALVACTLMLVWFFSAELDFELVFARFYGLFVFAAALAALAYLLAAEAQKVPGWLLSFTFLAHLLLVSTHVLGVLYSGATLLACVVASWRQHSFGRRVPLYVSIALAWLVLLPSRQAIVNTANVGKPRFWIETPYVHSLFAAYYAWSLPLVIAFVATFAAISVQALLRMRALSQAVPPPRNFSKNHRPLLTRAGFKWRFISGGSSQAGR